MEKIEVKSSCVVRMAGATATPISKMELTPWDLQLLLLDPIQKGILFQNPKPLILHHLKNALSRTLDFFPPLAGRLAAVRNRDDGTTSFFVDCNNEGAEFTHAVAAAASVSDILEPKHIPKIVTSFFPLNGVPNFDGVSKPLLAVQVTELADGIFIGCTANHTVVDGTSFWHFFNSWSEISRGLDSISKTPVFKPWFPTNVPDDDRLIRLPPLEENKTRNSQPLHESVFHFSKESLMKLKAKANAEAGTDKISSLQALSAHLWRSSVRSSQTIDDQGIQVSPLVMLVGSRGRIPLPEGYFGNAVYSATTTVSAAELLQKGLGYAAAKINQMVAEQSDEVVIKWAEEWVEKPVLLRRGGFGFVVASSPRHNVYGCDFGWGKPIAVRSGPGQKSDGKMTLFPAAEAGGVDVEVCMAAEKLQVMLDDADFMEAFTFEDGL